MSTPLIYNVSAAVSSSWTEVAAALHLSVGVSAEKLRLGVFWLAAAPGYGGIDQLAELYDDWNSDDWENALRIAEAEGMLSWCVHRLRQTPLSCSPALLDAVAPLVLHHRQRNRLIGLAAIECLHQLREAGVNALWIKGAPLAMRLYGDELLRDVRDIDLLVRPEQAGASIRALHATGYETTTPMRMFNDKRYLVSHRQTTLRALRGWLEVDLHWHLLEPWLAPNGDTNTMIDFTQPDSTRIFGHDVAVGTDEQVTRLIDANVLSSHRTEFKSSVDFVRHHSASPFASERHSTDADGSTTPAQRMCKQTATWLLRLAAASRVSSNEVARDLFQLPEKLPIGRWQAWRQHGKRAVGWRGWVRLVHAAWHRAVAHASSVR